MDKPDEYYELHAAVCKTFGHPKRLRVIDLLQDKELTVSDIAKKTGIDISNLSQHLHIMKDKGILQIRREGTKVFYKLSHPNIWNAVQLMSAFLHERIDRSQRVISVDGMSSNDKKMRFENEREEQE